jgi:hypothetical protein
MRLGREPVCVGGRLMRDDPQPDDPWLQTDRGECPDCRGEGCDQPDDDSISPDGDC